MWNKGHFHTKQCNVIYVLVKILSGTGNVKTRSIWKMLGPFATASRFTLPFTRCRYCRTPPLSHAAWYSRSQHASPLQELVCDMGSYSVTCHPAEVTFPQRHCLCRVEGNTAWSYMTCRLTKRRGRVLLAQTALLLSLVALMRITSKEGYSKNHNINIYLLPYLYPSQLKQYLI